MKITVIGCGRWGSFIAWYLAGIGHEVTLYGRRSDPGFVSLEKTRRNDYLTLPESISLCDSLEQALRPELIVISIGSQGLRGLAREMAPFTPRNKTFVLCMKGLEQDSGCRLTEIMAEETDPSCRTAVWIGPGHVQAFTAGVPNCMVIDSADPAVKESLVPFFSSRLIRFYYGTDLIGNEIGAASKNVIGIAAGMLDGLGLTALKGALMARGTREIARLIRAMGGDERSAYGLCHLGDYEATVFSPYSHNRCFGEAFVKGESFESLAEGYYTVKALLLLGDRYDVELPISRAVEGIIYEKADPRQTISSLFTRGLKMEF